MAEGPALPTVLPHSSFFIRDSSFPRLAGARGGAEMFEWLKQHLRLPSTRRRSGNYAPIDVPYGASGGDETGLDAVQLGTLPVPSGAIMIRDPQYSHGVSVEGISADSVTISARLCKSPKGTIRIAELIVDCGVAGPYDSVRTLGTVANDSAKMIVADREALAVHWAEAGPDRVGVITIARDEAVRQLLEKRFGLRTVTVSATQCEIVEPLSLELEREIELYLKSLPEYAAFPFIHFRVRTNNSFKRANYLDGAWGFIPIGNEERPLMFVGTTGHGDGAYDLRCRYVANVPVRVEIEFA